MQLTHNHTLCSINDESTLRRHQGDFAHVHLFFLGAFLFSQLERDVQRRAICLSFPLRFESGPFRLTDVIDRKSTRLNSSHITISYAVFCVKKRMDALDYTTRQKLREVNLASPARG